ncbi:hypothetical protein LB506_007478 [Fusarium annulatum]|nr:hypothetical protein LB506_007478 [Fusarium annulatum]
MPPQPTFLKMNESVRYRSQPTVETVTADNQADTCKPRCKIISLADDEFEHGTNTFHYQVCTSSVSRRQAGTYLARGKKIWDHQAKQLSEKGVRMDID